ncbi:MAG TPA: ATP-binding protein [Polyangia bacterium]|nr:ATP-binding protein [Polyangia bacterium]
MAANPTAPTIEEVKRGFARQLAAAVGEDGARRLGPAVDAFVAAVAAAPAQSAAPAPVPSASAASAGEVTALRERNRMLQALLDALPDRVALYDHATTRLVFANRSVIESLQEQPDRPTDALIGKTIAELNLPAQVLRDNSRNFARVGAGEQLRHEVLMPTADSWRWRETLMSPVRDEEGVVASVAVSSRDIHARKLAESRLTLLSKLTGLADAIDHEGMFAALARLAVPELGDWCFVDAVRDGQLVPARVAHHDPALAPLAAELTATPRSPALAASLRALVDDGAFVLPEIALDDDDSLRAHPELAALMKRLAARSLMAVPLVLDGELTAVATFVWSGESPWRYCPDDRAIAQAIAGRATQTLENARLHAQLRESEERFRVALAHSQVSLFEVDRELRFRWLQLPIGEGPEAPIGRTVNEIAGEENTLAPLLSQAIDSGQGLTREVEINADGERLCLLASIEPLRDAGGDIVGAIGAATEITETKRVQEELARALGFRDQMLGILGHDLRNPLSAVTGLTGLMLLDPALSAGARGQVEHIQEAARRMAEMIRTLLDFAQSRFKSGGLPVTPTPCDLAEIAAAAVGDLRAVHHARVIELEAPASASGHWDAGRMAQVVSNLVGNAIAHGDRAAPVRVALDLADDQVVLRVSNRGPMIPRDLVPALFEPFRQGGASTTGGARGLGLGLYIVDQIVRGHGGTIAVDSTPEGTTFCVRVPRGR